ncbi:MAG TPA: hypothetical protein VFX59_22515 [Polyangiales bacterium]|nr:hypothetical protein [Polyangiales bacterium]
MREREADQIEQLLEQGDMPEPDQRRFLGNIVEARYGDRITLTAADDVAPLALAPEQLDAVIGDLVENALRHGV